MEVTAVCSACKPAFTDSILVHFGRKVKPFWEETLPQRCGIIRPAFQRFEGEAWEITGKAVKTSRFSLMKTPAEAQKISYYASMRTFEVSLSVIEEGV